MSTAELRVGDWVLWVRHPERPRAVVVAHHGHEVRVGFKNGRTCRVSAKELVCADAPPGESAEEWLTRVEGAIDEADRSE